MESKNNKKLAAKVGILLTTNISHIDKIKDDEKASFSITFELYFINKTEEDVHIPCENNDLQFFACYKSIKNKDFLAKPSFPFTILYFFGGRAISLKANSYVKIEFEYAFTDDEFNKYIMPDKYNIFQGWCESLSGEIRSNIVNIPIISHGQEKK